MECGKGPSAADLASRGAESTGEAAPRGRLWLNDGSCVRLRPEHENQVWSYDFVSGFTHDGRTLTFVAYVVLDPGNCRVVKVWAWYRNPSSDPRRRCVVTHHCGSRRINPIQVSSRCIGYREVSILP